MYFRGLYPGAALGLLLGLGCASSLAEPPVQLTSSAMPVVQVGDLRVLANQPLVAVPILVKEEPLADGLFLTVDYDGALLEYAWYRDVKEGWEVQRTTPYGDRRVAFLLQRTGDLPALDEDSTPWQGTLFKVLFVLRSSAPPAQTFRLSTPVAPGVEAAPGQPGDSFFFASSGDAGFHAFPTSLRAGEVTIYYRDGLEMGSGAVTTTAQDFRLPLYLTSLKPDQRLFLVGVDYDELFLNITGVRGTGPTVSDELEETFRTPAPGRMEFQVTLPADFEGEVCHLHVADLQFTYGGQVPAGGSLPVQPSLLLPDNDGGQVGGGGTYGGAVPGTVEFLPPHFVRGNVDSSLGTGRDGQPSYAADLADARLMLQAIFLGTYQLECVDAGDVNDSGSVDLSDVIWLLNHFYRSGQPPPLPYPHPGPDPSDNDSLDCARPLPIFVPQDS